MQKGKWCKLHGAHSLLFWLQLSAQQISRCFRALNEFSNFTAEFCYAHRCTNKIHGWIKLNYHSHPCSFLSLHLSLHNVLSLRIYRYMWFHEYSFVTDIYNKRMKQAFKQPVFISFSPMRYVLHLCMLSQNCFAKRIIATFCPCMSVLPYGCAYVHPVIKNSEITTPEVTKSVKYDMTTRSPSRPYFTLIPQL